MVLGSAFLWIGIPLLGLWLAGELTDTASTFLLVDPDRRPGVDGRVRLAPLPAQRALRGHARAAPSAAGTLGVARELERRARALRRARGPRTLIDVSMTASAVAALILMAIWFFFLAESPLAPLP